MSRRKRWAVAAIIIIASVGLGGLSIKWPRRIDKNRLATLDRRGDTADKGWADHFTIVRIKSRMDGDLQPAYFCASAPGARRPLVVSLHTWSGDYSQADALARLARQEGWNYIHPDFRGPNRTMDACLSDKVISDIDDAIDYAKTAGQVDADNIFMVGLSGGGYAVLGMYIRTRHKIKAFMAWAPISDLAAWRHQSKARGTPYARDIVNCTCGAAAFDENKARARSPLYWPLPINANGRMELYAGIDDGYTSSVPISHAILFFNRLARHYGHAASCVSASDMVDLLTRGRGIENGFQKIEGRAVVYQKKTPAAALVIFQGGHELLPVYCFQRMRRLAENEPDKEE